MKVLRILLASLAIAFAAPAFAANHTGEFIAGEVRKVDKDSKKITLKHEEIRHLDMPPMSMVFQVADAAVLDKFKAGDKVRFKAVNEGGRYVVVEIQAVK